MISKVKDFLNKRFIKNVLVLVTGTAAAQAITMATAPVITRLYGPEAFGVMGTFNALVSVIVPIAALTYPIAIVLPKQEKEAKAIFKLSILISFILSIFIFIILLLFKDSIAILLNMEHISNYFYLLPIVIVFSGFMQVMTQWLIRIKEFTINAKATVIQSLIVNLSKIGVGLFLPIAQVLIFFTAISSGLHGLLMYIISNRQVNRLNIIKLFKSKGNIKEVAKKHKDFPLYRAPQDLLFALQQSFPIILLTSFFGPIATGYYTISRSVLSMPTLLIGKAVADAFYPRASETFNRGEDISSILIKSTLGLLVVGLVPFGVIIAFGPTIFAFVFGSDWYSAGEYARWIALWSYTTLINRPSIMTLPVLNAQRFHLIYTIILAIVNLIALIIGFKVFNSDVMSVALFSLSGAIANIFLISITIRLSKIIKVTKDQSKYS